ncbi:MAG: dihydrofolate reductase [Methylococcales bacterium]|nr:dihydrofolate reductase [Methylococcales bacterium]
MTLSLIVAMATNRVIGLNQQIPWHLSADLKRFKQITLGHPILMGRKTYESIGKPLPGRKNIIISRNLDYQQQGCEVFNEFTTAMESCSEAQELFIIGGASFYESTLDQADVIYLTEIHQTFEGDTYFPKINPLEWQEVERETINNDPKVNFSYSFVKLQRIT